MPRSPALSPAGVEAALEATSILHIGPPKPMNTLGSGPVQLGPLNPGGTIGFGTGSEINPDGSDPRQIAITGFGYPSPRGMGDAAWTADHTTIAFDDGSALWTAPAAGCDPWQIAPPNGETQPAWSPDGTYLAYSTQYGISVVRYDGLFPRALVPGDPSVRGGNVDPLWSPAGTAIAWLAGGPGKPRDIWVMNSDGTDARAVYTAPSSTPVGSVAWSPDGTQLLFAISSGMLWTVDTDGSGARYVTDAPYDEPAGTFTWWDSPVPAPVNTVAPVVSGTPAAGQILAASSGAWAPAEGATYTFAWSRCAKSGKCTPISGATDDAYPVTAADAGSTLRVTVTATNSAGAASGTSDPTPVVAQPPPVATTLPTVGVDAVLSLSSKGSWTGAQSFSYQWRKCDSAGGDCTDVAGATGTSYTPPGAGVFRLAVTGANASGTTTATSAVAGGSLSRHAPDTPTAPSATPGTESATVSFSPGSDGGSAITAYTVTVSPGGGQVTGTSSPIAITGLTNGTRYTFTVTAANALGPSAPSAPSNGVVPGNATCRGSLGDTTVGGAVTVPRLTTCVLANDDVEGNVVVQPGAGLREAGSTVGGDLKATEGAWLELSGAGEVDGRVIASGTTGTPPAGGDATATANELCDTTVAGTVHIYSSAGGAPFDIGGSGCAAGLTVGGTLQVNANAGAVEVTGNTAAVVQVTANAGGGSVTGNTAAGACKLVNDEPPLTGSGNAAGHGHTNTCNRNA